MKTIRMKKEYLDKWLAALRSGKYRQGSARLKTLDGKFCCLGVLQCVLDGDVEYHHGSTKDSLPLPSESWLKNKGIEFTGNESIPEKGNPRNPLIPKQGYSLAYLNDSLETGFKALANLIEEATETF